MHFISEPSSETWQTRFILIARYCAFSKTSVESSRKYFRIFRCSLQSDNMNLECTLSLPKLPSQDDEIIVKMPCVKRKLYFLRISVPALCKSLPNLDSTKMWSQRGFSGLVHVFLTNSSYSCAGVNDTKRGQTVWMIYHRLVVKSYYPKNLKPLIDI